MIKIDTGICTYLSKSRFLFPVLLTIECKMHVDAALDRKRTRPLRGVTYGCTAGDLTG